MQAPNFLGTKFLGAHISRGLKMPRAHFSHSRFFMQKNEFLTFSCMFLSTNSFFKFEFQLFQKIRSKNRNKLKKHHESKIVLTFRKNCSRDLKIFLDQQNIFFSLTEGQNNFGNKIPLKLKNSVIFKLTYRQSFIELLFTKVEMPYKEANSKHGTTELGQTV